MMLKKKKNTFERLSLRNVEKLSNLYFGSREWSEILYKFYR